MGFHGLSSVGEYEAAARSHGLRTRRIPFHRGREGFFVLVTESAKSRPGAVKRKARGAIDVPRAFLMSDWRVSAAV